MSRHNQDFPYRPLTKTILTKYYTEGFIHGSGAPQKPRVIALNTILIINTILKFHRWVVQGSVKTEGLVIKYYTDKCNSDSQCFMKMVNTILIINTILSF